jgi:hypothetical protein
MVVRPGGCVAATGGPLPGDAAGCALETTAGVGLGLTVEERVGVF